MGRVSVAVPFEDNWYFDTVVAGIRSALAVAGHEAVVHLVPYGREARAAVAARFEEDLRDPGSAGAIAVTFRLERAAVARLRALGGPVVLVSGSSAELASAHIDDLLAARLATEHLLGLGHRSILHLAGYTVGPDDSSMRGDRVRGYSEAMQAAGLGESSAVRPCEFDAAAARRTALRLLAADRPTAVFAVTDEVALGVLEAAADLGLRVPQDLSVVGIDDEPRAAAAGLTTVRQDPAALGAEAVALLLAGGHPPDRVLPVALLRRTSTAPPASPPRLRGLGRLLRRRDGERSATG